MNVILILVGIYMILGVVGAFAFTIFKENEVIRKRSLGIIAIVLIMITFGLTMDYIVK